MLGRRFTKTTDGLSAAPVGILVHENEEKWKAYYNYNMIAFNYFTSDSLATTALSVRVLTDV